MRYSLKALFKRKAVVITAISALILVALIATALLTGVLGNKPNTETPGSISTGQDESINPKAQSGLVGSLVDISADESDSLGISTTTAFKLTFNKASDEKTVATSMNVEPEQAFSIKKLSDKEFSMEFQEPLKGNSIYSLTLNDKDTGEKKSWAFQTKKQFNVIRSMPRNKSTRVPLNSGIEITFSHIGIENPDEYFEISPKIEGRFEWNKKILIFVPAQSFKEDTIYTVTVKKGLGIKGSDDILQDDYIFEFQTESTEKDSSERFFRFYESMYNYTPRETPALQIYASEELKDTTVPLELYSYPDIESFMHDLKKATDTPSWAHNNNKDVYDLTNLTKTVALDGQIIHYQRDFDYWQNSYVLFPSEISEGHYLVVAEIEGRKYYTLLQINKASVYIMTTVDQTLLWLNDTTNGQPISGASFTLGQSSAITDSKGLAVIDANNGKFGYSMNYFVIYPQIGPPFATNLEYYNNNYSYNYDYDSYSSPTSDDYWAYMYFDRDVYLPSDTINIWGILKPRDGAVSETKAVLELCNRNYTPDGNSTSILTSQDVTISPDGTFIGSLKIIDYNPQYLFVQLRVGDETMLTEYLEIAEYTKPLYKLDISPDKNNVFAWDTVNYDITSSFFEGTPASGFKLDYSKRIKGNNDKGTLESDNNGKARLVVKPTTTETGWKPIDMRITVSNSVAEEQQVYEYSYINVFPKDTMIEVKSKTEDGTDTLSFTTSRIDISQLDGLDRQYYSPDDYRGKSVDMPVTVFLYERYYERTKTGDYYDHINKVRRDTYRYDQKERLIQEYNFSTVNGKFDIQYASDKSKQYFIKVFGKDSSGRSIEDTVHIYNWESYDPYITDTYRLVADWQKVYKTDEKVEAEVRYLKDEPYTGGSRKYLFIRLRNGILDYTISENPIYSFGFENKLIPNVYVKALCFDGKGIYSAGMEMYRYDKEEKKLNIEVSTDKESYKPGDEINLSVTVKDSSGKPVVSEVNISMVDEAYFALYDQYVNTLDSLYNPLITSGFINDYLSYTPVMEFGSSAAEMGGEGGGDGIRSDMKDTAVFTRITTGANGIAEVSFKVPDNLTSWRVTTQAVTKDLQAGNTITNISTKLPFFVNSVFNTRFMTGDIPSIMVQANGEELGEDDMVSFKVTIFDDEGRSKGTYTTKGLANVGHEIQLDKLSKGTYVVRIEGSSGNLSDGMERSFTVSDNMLETTVVDLVDLTNDTIITNNAKGLTTLEFFNKDSTALYSELSYLYRNWGRRIDQVLARKTSGKLLQNYFNRNTYTDDEADLSDYQMSDGGLALFTYDSSSPEISAKMCSLAADGIDRNSLASYFYELIDDEKATPGDKIYAYWGLAALKKPVLLEIRSILESEELDLKSRLVLGVALADAGDYQGASAIYREAMEKAGTVTNVYAFVENGSRDDTIEATALCSLIALKINAPEKLELFNYVKSNSTSTLQINLESMIFVTNYIKDASLKNSFTYELDGVIKSVELQRGSCLTLTLTPEKLATIKFSEITGNINVAASYTSPISEHMKTDNNLVSIERVYDNGSTTTFKRSDIVKVKLTVNFDESAPDGYYEVTDILPAGFRYIQPVYGQNYPYEVTGQKVIFGYYYNKNTRFKKDRIISYYAKVVTPGSYTADSAAIRHADMDIADFSEKIQVIINK